MGKHHDRFTELATEIPIDNEISPHLSDVLTLVKGPATKLMRIKVAVIEQVKTLFDLDFDDAEAINIVLANLIVSEHQKRLSLIIPKDI